MTINHEKVDIYEQITNAIISAIEEGTEKYDMPWHALSTPINATNRKPYRGVNILVLWVVAHKRGYASNEWATYNQWKQAGAQVRKAERSATVVFWKFSGPSQQSEDQDQDKDSESTTGRPRCFARAYNVFNAAQVDGYTSPAAPQLSEDTRIENADRFFASLPGVVKHGGDEAFYSPSGDYIQMPPFAQFKSAESYVNTISHEYTHWSGSPSRLNRDLSGRFGGERYAMEELVAELGSAFLCADLQIQSEPRADHAPYAASWLRALRNDKRAIFTAASKAQEATSYLQELAALSEERAS